jgi:hypothetical protein
MGNLMLWLVVLLALLGLAVGAYPKRTIQGSNDKPAGAMDIFLETLNGAKKHLVSAAVARSVSILGLYPVDTIKTRIFLVATASLLGDLTGSFCLCPSEVIKQRIQAGIFSSQREALTSIWQARGFLGFYEGYLGGLARDIPFRVAQLVSSPTI